MGNVVIITGMSGVKPKLVLQKYNSLPLKNGPVKIVDIEELLVQEAKKNEAISNALGLCSSASEQEDIMAVTSLPYPALMDLWARAVERAKQQIKRRPQNDQNVALVLHTVYFKPDSTEFIPIVDATILKTLEPTCVVHLIDDIYDIHAWLRAPKGIFDRSTAPSDPAEQIQGAIRELWDILIWRQAEAGSSAHLAGLLNVPLWTMATKHRCTLLQRVFEKPSILPAYLSHPISEPRRALVRGDTELAERCSSDVGALADHLARGLEVWEPTTIDEFRMRQAKLKDAPDRESAKVYLPRLTKRWPFGKVEEVLWTEPPCPPEHPLDPARFFSDEELDKVAQAETWQDVDSLLGTRKSSNLHLLSGQLEDLAGLIGQQINTRDRTLVAQCPIIVVYRPLFNGNDASGVATELQVHNSRSELDHYKVPPRAFVLETSEDERLLWRNIVVKLLCGKKDKTGQWHGYVREQDGSPVGHDRAIEIADHVTNGQSSAETITDSMTSAARELGFRWGESDPSPLNGKAADARQRFLRIRQMELETQFDIAMQYRKDLKQGDTRSVCIHEDMDIISFAEKVLDTFTTVV